MQYRPLLILFLIVLSPFLSFSAIILEGEQREYKVLSNTIGIFEDPTGRLSLSDILENKNISFVSGGDAEKFTVNSSNIYWLRLEVINKSRVEDKWVLEILDSRFDEVVFYYPGDTSMEYTFKKTGMDYPFKEREYNHKNFVFDFPLSPEKQYYYLKIRPGVIGSLLFKIRKNSVFSSYAFKEYLLLGLYYGILLIMAFYNLLLFCFIKERIYIYYFFYVLSWAYYSTLGDGLGFQFFWSDWPIISHVGSFLAKPLILAFFVLYALNFLDIKNVLPSSRPKIYLCLFAYCLLSFIFNRYSLVFLDNLVFAFAFGYLLYVARLAFQRGFEPARFFLLGNGLIIIGLIIYMLKSAGSFNYLIYDFPQVLTVMVYSRNVTMICDIVILSIALADRIRFLKESKEQTQSELIYQLNEKKLLGEKVNRELEQKVMERTKVIEEKNQQLLDANKRLAEQADAITKMNAMLDKDNWNLKKNVKTEKEARLVQKEFDFLEFQQVYPNESAFFRFLEELKWSGSYCCRKCGHDKYGKSVNVFARRCSKCRYDESITAYTIFHKCKFDLCKALYITMMVNRYGENVSIADISREIEIRNATCWSFAKKVLTFRNSKEYSKINEGNKLKYLILQN